MERKTFIQTLLLGCAGLYLITRTEDTSGMYSVTRDENGVETVYKNGKYQFCPEFQAVYDALYHKPSKKLCIATDKRIRDLKEKGIWQKMELFCYIPGFMENKHDALINWKNP
jgi:hypothetical protein